jgi:hypothetical protein
MSKRCICEKSLEWILHFRKSSRVYRKHEDYLWTGDYTKQSWNWIVEESRKIDNIGWDNWWLTNGPEGFKDRK